MTAPACTCETFGVCAACAPSRAAGAARPPAPADCPHPAEYVRPDSRRRLVCARCGSTIAQEARHDLRR